MAEGYNENKLVRREEVLELRIKIGEESHEKEIAHKNSLIADAKAKNEVLENENEDLKTQVQDEKELRKMLESKGDEKQQHINELKAQVTVLQKEREDLSVKIKRLDRKDAQKSEEIKQLKKQVEQINEEIEVKRRNEQHLHDQLEERLEKSMEKSIEKSMEKSMEKCMEKCVLDKIENLLQKGFSKLNNGNDTTKTNNCSVKEAKNLKISNETYNVTVKSNNGRNFFIPNKQDFTFSDQKSSRRNKNRPN
ncbi:KIF20 [Mytilus coruscus]|uniref:KIF20 n=1 Tax=Mytilus coruscus TaxID=42192 RepID=A0A6J8AL79_MYTCO|nr:KIF20 [Mytilus coruscus]